jgi:hypothetical protein
MPVELVIMKHRVYIMAPEAISMAYFINPIRNTNIADCQIFEVITLLLLEWLSRSS